MTKRHFSNELFHEGRLVEFTPQTVWAVVTESPEPLCSQEVLAQLGDLQNRMEAICQTMERYSPSNIQNYQNEQRDQLEADALAGNMPDGVTLRSREAVSEDFRAKQAALNKVLVKITHEEVVPLAKPILLQFEKVVEDFLRNGEEGERDLCESFGVEYKPSIIWKAVMSVAMRYTAENQLPKPSLWKTPKSILDFIIQF